MTVLRGKCPTCGSAVALHGSEEGTAYYRPDPPPRTARFVLDGDDVVDGDRRVTLLEAVDSLNEADGLWLLFLEATMLGEKWKRSSDPAERMQGADLLQVLGVP